jgi:hypothetical protein
MAYWFDEDFGDTWSWNEYGTAVADIAMSPYHILVQGPQTFPGMIEDAKAAQRGPQWTDEELMAGATMSAVPLFYGTKLSTMAARYFLLAGAGVSMAAVSLGMVGGGIFGTAIAGAIWGREGSQKALEFYSDPLGSDFGHVVPLAIEIQTESYLLWLAIKLGLV